MPKYVCVCEYMYTYVYIYTHIYIYIYTYIHIYMYIYIYICDLIHVYVYIYLCTSLHCVCIYIYISFKNPNDRCLKFAGYRGGSPWQACHGALKHHRGCFGTGYSAQLHEVMPQWNLDFSTCLCFFYQSCLCNQSV